MPPSTVAPPVGMNPWAMDPVMPASPTLQRPTPQPDRIHPWIGEVPCRSVYPEPTIRAYEYRWHETGGHDYEDVKEAFMKVGATASPAAQWNPQPRRFIEADSVGGAVWFDHRSDTIVATGPRGFLRKALKFYAWSLERFRC